MAYRLAIIGLGKIAQDQHLPCVAKNPAFELAAVVSSRPTSVQAPRFKTPGELFNSGIALDAVSLCMPPGPRYAIARQAVDAGLHLLLEKPPTPTVGEMLALSAHAAHSQRLLFTTWHSQFNAAVDEAKRLLAGKVVKSLQIAWKEDVRHWHPGQDWIWAPGGFGVFDPGINALSIVTKILPAPIFVASAVLKTPRNKATPIAAEVTFKPSWPGTADLSASLDWRQTGEQTWTIAITTADGLALRLEKGGVALYVNDKLTLANPSEEYEAIYARFADLLAANRSEIDLAPLQLVADCFMMGKRVDVEAFE